MMANPNNLRLAALLAIFLVLGCRGETGEASQAGHTQAVDPVEERYHEEVAALVDRTDVQAALRYLEESDAQTVQDQIELTEIPSPPFGEEVRARRYAEMLSAYGADSVWTDPEGNVLALRRGSEGGRLVAVAGHLDTVFPEGTDVTATVRGDTVIAPGISDNGRGIAVVAAVLRAISRQDIRPAADLLFIGTVGETGLGDLRGMKELFGPAGPGIDAFVSVDASGDRHVVHKALGSRRYRVTYRGPGGHSWRVFGYGNPQHALGEAIHRFDTETSGIVTDETRDTYNVGRIGGGTSVNAVPMDAWMEVDMRSEDPEQLMVMDAVFNRVVEEVLDIHNERRTGGDALTLEVELVGDRPSGELDPAIPLVQRGRAVTEFFGHEPSLERSSTDSNIPISLGIPAFTTGGGGIGLNHHAMTESWVNENGAQGIQRVMLIILAEAESEGGR